MGLPTSRRPDNPVAPSAQQSWSPGTGGPFLPRQPAIESARSVPRARGPCDLRTRDTQPSFTGFLSTLGDGYCSRAAASTAPLSLKRPVDLPSPRAAAAASTSCVPPAWASHPSQHSVSAVLPRVVSCVAVQAYCRCFSCYWRGRCCCHGRCHHGCGCGCHRYHVESNLYHLRRRHPYTHTHSPRAHYHTYTHTHTHTVAVTG